jgi:Leishmanolysin
MKYGLQDDCHQVDRSKFNICLDLKSASGTYEPWMEAFGRARDRWQEIIVEDSLAPINIQGYVPVKEIATELPALVDDLYVSCSVAFMDGPGGILGTAGPTLIREYNGIAVPLSGVMRFDKDDADNLGDEEWNTVILHELGHVLGFGTLFETSGLHSGNLTSDLYLGANANAEWQKLCPNGRIPIETDGGAGTAGGHWDEECLRGELMTGFLGGGSAVLSRLTIAAFKDLGYGVNMDAADAYTVSDLGDCGGYCPSLRRGLRPKARFDLRKVKVSEAGRQLVLEAGAKELKARRTNMPSELPAGVTYVGGDMITVYLRDYDGILKEDTVTFDDVRDHMSNTGILSQSMKQLRWKATIHKDTNQAV